MSDFFMKVRKSFQPPHRVVDHGYVWCPSKGDVSVSECMSCPSLIDHDIEGDDPWVACRAVRQPISPLPGLIIPKG